MQNSFHHVLMMTHLSFHKRIMAEAKKLGLTSGQPKILEFLREAQEADQKTIAEHCEIEQATAGSILMRMEEAELIHRRQRKGNRRSLYVSLTEKGMQAAENMQAVFDKTDELAASALTAEELEQLKQSLKKISLVLSDNNYERKTAK